MPTDVKMFERGCTCNAWKTRTHYHYGPMELFQRPVEPDVTWHMDLVMGFPAVSSGGGYSGGGHDLMRVGCLRSPRASPVGRLLL
jgi:hypothetical protein